MKNDQGLKWGFIIALILMVGFAVGFFYLLSGNAERQAKVDEAVADLKKCQDTSRSLMTDLDAARMMIGGYPPNDDDKVKVTMADIQAKFDANRVIGKATSLTGFEFPSTMDRNYENMVSFMYDALLAERKKYDGMLIAVNNMRSDVVKANADAKTEIAEAQKNADIAIADKNAETAKHEEDMEKANATVASANNLRAAADNKAMISEQKAAIAVDTAEQTVREAQSNLERTSTQLAAYQNPNFDAPDGYITSVNPMNQTVKINRGSDDNLRTRMTFSVYDPSISNIAIADKVAAVQAHNLNNGRHKDEGVCEVCLKMMSLNLSKASIEVIEILGPHSALARILVDELADPVAPGDVIHTPLWNPGETQKFALIGDMKSSFFRNEGKESIETLKAIIKLNGGEVVFWVDQNGNIIDQSNKVVPLNEINNVLRTVSYLIVGDTAKVANTYIAVQQIARSHGTVEITLPTLMRQMGVSPMSTVTGFGKDATEDDLRIKPTGVAPTVSNSAVSPIYLKDQIVPSSNSKVSDLYEKGSQPQQKAPTGSDSDLFRKRTIPGASR